MTARLLPRTLPDDRPVALLLRHSERPPIPEGSMGMSLELTERGVRAAREFGQALKGRVVFARTSAVRRCVQTASALLEGSGTPLAPVEDPALGVPSTFIKAGPETEKTLRALGFERFMEHLVSGDAELPGLVHPAEGARLLREHALSSLTPAAGLHLFVTHDAMIAALVARSWREPLDGGGWPAFLEGAALWREGAAVMLSYRDRCRAVD